MVFKKQKKGFKEAFGTLKAAFPKKKRAIKPFRAITSPFGEPIKTVKSSKSKKKKKKKVANQDNSDKEYRRIFYY